MNRFTYTMMTALMAILALAMVTGQASAKEVDLSKTAFKYGKMKYWRGKAENVRIGSYGDKKVNGKYLAVDAHMKTKHYEARLDVAGPFTVNFEKFNRKSLGASVRYLTTRGTGSLSWEKAKKGNLKLMKFFLTEKNLRKALNGKANGAFKGLVKEGNDGRIVSEIWVVVEASLSEDITKAGGFTAQYKGGTLFLRGRAKSSSTHKNALELAPGTTFAYLMHKVKKWNKKKGEKVGVADLEDDQPGMR